jgi:hypothetical protein
MMQTVAEAVKIWKEIGLQANSNPELNINSVAFAAILGLVLVAVVAIAKS